VLPTDAEFSFIDQVGRALARQYGLPPTTGRVMGWLLICDPPAPTAAEIAEALQISRSAVGSAVTLLEQWDLARRHRPPGERADRIAVIAAAGEPSLDNTAEFGAMTALAQHGLGLLEGESLERRARLLELKAFGEFLVERMPQVAEEWRERRRRLRESGELP